MISEEARKRNTAYKREWRKQNPKRTRELWTASNKKRKGKRKPLTEKQKARKVERSKIWVLNNPERARENWKKNKEKARRKMLRKYFTQLIYERKNPNRNKKKLAVAKSLTSGD